MQSIILPEKTAPLAQWAAFYASLNFPIIPLYEATTKGQCSCLKKDCSSVGKHPRLKNGLKDASTNIETIQLWWKKWPKANIGIITGKASRKIVIDIDPKNGGLISLEHWQSQYGNLLGWKVRSGGNGLHFYFNIPANLSLKNKVNLLPGIDVRGDGGYIVAPPSSHQSGNLYQWESATLDHQELPNWLIEEIEKKPITQKLNSNITVIGEGNRNNFLASIAGTLKKHQFDLNSIGKFLCYFNQEACDPSLTAEEVLSVAKSISQYHAEEEPWDEMIELPVTSYEIPLMDDSFIPISLQDWIIDVSQRMQVPFEFILVPAIVGISAIIGRKIRIYPKKNDDWMVVPNLWGAIVARPGSFKSPAIAAALRPIESLVELENQCFSKKIKNWEIDKTINEATLDAIKDQLIKSIKKNNLEESEVLKERLQNIRGQLDSNIPICKRLKTNDATVEKLIQLLLENPNGLLVIRDELAGWLISLNKYGREGDREFYLEAWNGYGSYTLDRIGRGTVHVPSLCLSLFGGIQPDKLEKLITSALDTNDDGLLQRFQLVIFPEIKGKWKNHDVAPNVKAQKKVEYLIHKLYSFESPDNEKPIGLRFDDESQEIFNNWREKLEELLRSNIITNSHYEAHLSKYRSLVPSLALIFQLLHNEDNIFCPTAIQKDAILLAIKWAEYLSLHAKKIYRVHDYPFHHSVQAFKAKLAAKKITDGDTIRSISRHCWEHLTTSEQVENAVSFLCQHHWIKVKEVNTGFRPSRIIKINPSLFRCL